MADVRIKTNPKNPSKGAHKFDEGSVLSVLLKTALPIVILMLFNSAYAFVDSLMSSAFVTYGEYNGAHLNGGTIIGLLFPFMGILIAFEVMVAVGCGLSYTQSMAQGNHDEANQRHNESMSIIIYIGLIVIAVIAVFGIPYTLTVAGNWNQEAWGPENSRQMLMDGYLYMIILGFSFIPMQIQQSYIRVLRAEGVGDAAAIIPILTFPINIFCDWLFMSVLDTGIYGAGIATLIASVSGVIMMSIFIWYQGLSDKLVIKLKAPRMTVHKEVAIVILAFSMGSLLRRLFDGGTVIVLSAYIGNINTESMTGILAERSSWQGSWTTMTRSINMGTMLSLGVAQTVSMLVSYYANSNQMNKVGETIKYGFLSMVVCTLLAVALLFGIQGLLFNAYDHINAYGWEWFNPISTAFILALIYSIPLAIQPMPVMFYAGMKRPKLTLIHTVVFNAIVVTSATIGLIVNIFTGQPLYLFGSLVIGATIGLITTLFIFGARYKEINK